MQAALPSSRGLGARPPRRVPAPARAAATSATSGGDKLRIKLKSYWSGPIVEAADAIKAAAESTGATVAGPVPLPTRCVCCLGGGRKNGCPAARGAWACPALHRPLPRLSRPQNAHSVPARCLGWENAAARWLGGARGRGETEESRPDLRPRGDHPFTSKCSPLPSPPPPNLSRRIFTLLRSPHVNKDSREQFQQLTHSRLLDVKGVTSETVDKLMACDIPAGVDVEIKI